MNKELKEDRVIKISMPLLTEREMLEIDNNFNEIVNEVHKQYIKEKDLAIAQYIIDKQQKELEQKESILDKVTDKLKETIKKERQLMPYLPHKSVSFHYANGREVLAKEILIIIEGEKK